MLLFCQVALTVSNKIPGGLESEANPMHPDMVSPDFHEELLRRSTPFLLEDAIVDPGNSSSHPSFPFDDVVSENVTGSPAAFDNLKGLLDDEKLAVSLGSSDWALSLENLNSTFTKHQIGKSIYLFIIKFSREPS